MAGKARATLLARWRWYCPHAICTEISGHQRKRRAGEAHDITREELVADRRRLIVRCAALLFAVPLSAQRTLDSRDKQFANAAVLVLSHDLLFARCTEEARLPADGAVSIAAWSHANEAELIRGRTREPEQDPSQRAQFDVVRRMFASLFSARGQTACANAVEITRRPDAQFAIRASEMLTALRARRAAGDVAATAARPPASGTATEMLPSSGSQIGTSPASRSETGAPLAKPSAASAVLQSGAPAGRFTTDEVAARIDRFGFTSRPTIGVGGFVTIKVYPVVLFRDGAALLDITALSDSGGLDAHRSRHPSDWTRWRYQGATVEIQTRGTWKPLQFRQTYSALPPGFRLNGRFRSIGGVGDLAIGGTSSVTVVSEYTFATDGAVIRSGAAGASVSNRGGPVVTSSTAKSGRGRCSIEGVRLRIAFDHGSVEARILVTNPQDDGSAIWLDGEGYVARR